MDLEMETRGKAKVTILAGFLGSGKTTFRREGTTMIERIIKMGTLQSKIAIIQNEFSLNMGIEAPLMTNANGDVIDEFYELPNGCICCKAKDDLVSTLELLIDTKREIEHIIVETNGLADPSNIIKIFWLDDGLMSNIELNFTMGIVDAKNFWQFLQAEDTSEALKKQLVFADKILINKIDLVEYDKILSIEEEIRTFNPLAEIKHTEYANADLEYLITAPKQIQNFKERYSDITNEDNQNFCGKESEIHSHTYHGAGIIFI